MKKETLEALKIANEAIIEATKKKKKLMNAAADETVNKILTDKGLAYPFGKSLDDIYDSMTDWNFLAGEELEITIAVTEISEKIDRIGLTETGTVQIIKKLNEKYRDEIESYDADLEEYNASMKEA